MLLCDARMRLARLGLLVMLVVGCANKRSQDHEDFSGIADTKDDSPSGWVFRGRMEPGSQSSFTYSTTDRYQGILLRVDPGEGDVVADIRSDDGEPLVFLVQPDGNEVPAVESDAEGGHAHLEARDLAPGKYFLVTRERSNKAATFSVSLAAEDPPMGSGSGSGTGSGSGSGSGMGRPANCPNLPAATPMPNLVTAQVPTAPLQESDTEGNLVSDGAGHTLVTYTSLKFGGVFTGVTATIACTDDGHCDASTLGQFPYQGVGTGYTCDPVLARDASTGRAYLAWINVSPRGSSEIVIATSDDMGQSWQNAHVVASAKTNLLDKPWVTAAKGRVLVSYGDFDAGWGPTTMRVVDSKDGGHTFTDPVAVSPMPATQNLAQVALSADGMTAMISWWDNGVLHASIATNGTTQFAAPLNVATGGSVVFDPPGSALGADGRFWISYVRQAAMGSEVAVVAGTVNAMGALAFQPAVAVADAASRGCAHVMHPTVTTDETNAAHVAFYDDRYGVGHLWVTSSSDGTTWSPNASFTPQSLRYVPERGTSSFLGDYVGLIAQAGRTSAVFAQVPVDTTASPAAHFYFATSK
jgi:hypothetical protein